ncbi:7420_t:CDS:2, partial [Cetraspora pellucida]
KFYTIAKRFSNPNPNPNYYINLCITVENDNEFEDNIDQYDEEGESETKN